MSAAKVAETCYERWRPTEVLPAAMRADIDLLAGHFYQQGTFVNVFISTLVPWNELVGEPNEGHAAIADLLIIRAIAAALSANFDPLIEQWAERHKIALQGALNGTEAISFAIEIAPLLKFHGCLHRGREQTLWTQRQLTEPEIQARIASCSDWMNLHLANKDLLVVGFWTDWGYLNDVLANVIPAGTNPSITVIDPASSAELQAKAPMLWGKLTGASTNFRHVQASGADALEELRIEFSKVWSRKFFQLGKPLIEQTGGSYPSAMDSYSWNRDDLYNLRRDAQGVPYNRAATDKAPRPEAAQAAFVHILMHHAHAARHGAHYEIGGQTVRIVHGGGQALANVQGRYKEPPVLTPADIVICAGATDLGVPGSVIPSGRGSSIIRAAPGGGSRWLTLDQARAELGI